MGYDYVIAWERGLRPGGERQSDGSGATGEVPHKRAEADNSEDTPAPGKDSMDLLEMGIHWFQRTPEVERYFAIQWDGSQYVPVIPEQEGRAASLSYHSRKPRCWSSTPTAGWLRSSPKPMTGTSRDSDSTEWLESWTGWSRRYA